MEEKTCSKCNQLKPISEYPKDKTTKSGYCGYCKVCKRDKVKTAYLNNPDKHKNRVKQWSEANPDKVKQHVANSSEYKKQWYLDNKPRLNQLSKEYNQKKRIDEGVYWSNGEWVMVKPKMTPEERKLVNIFRDKVKRGIQTDRKKTFELLGCSFTELKMHLESQFYPEMNWGNWGEVWEMDHIVGCCNFDLTNPSELGKCFHYTNLRPLFKTTKIAKSFGYSDIVGNRNRPKKH